MSTVNFEVKKQKYRERMAFISERATLQKLLCYANLILAGSVYIAYPVLLGVLLVHKDSVLARAIIVPLDSFIILSVVRAFINRKRPYELYECASAIHKDKKGKSFPSRHVFSVFVIATTFLGVGCTLAGAILLFVGVCIAAVRVYCGVHFLSDVIAGAVAGVLSGVIGFWIL